MMKYIMFIFLALSCFACGENEDLITILPVEEEAFFVGYGGGWGVNVWYREHNGTVEKYNSVYVFDELEGGYANPDNWTVVTDDEFNAEIIQLRADFPAAALASVAPNNCPEVAYDGVCVQVARGKLAGLDNAIIWFRNASDNATVNAYLERINSVINR
ncbi:MAG: hypothetical protein AAF828_10855 [Bacteroidota bacterium]